MENEKAIDTDYLSDATEEVFGSGSELSTTGFLIFGLLTFWTYTVWNFHKLLTNHIKQRLEYFKGLLDIEELSNKNTTALKLIIENGFTPHKKARNISMILYLLSMILIVSVPLQQILYGYGFIGSKTFDFGVLIAVGIAVLLFSSADIYFMSWVCKTAKKHELNELLLARLAKNPSQFKMLQPSSKFVKRWDRNQNRIAFFIILSIPMTVSPLIGVRHVQMLLNSGGNYLQAIIIWSIIIFSFAAIFHLWGTQLLIDMYNGHLRIETINQQQFSIDSKWTTEKSTSVLADPTKAPEAEIDSSFIPERTLAAIMITDMVGFSKEMESNEDFTYTKLLKHNEIIREIISKNNGKEIKTIGDAFLVKFKSAVDAVKSAIEIQNKFSGYNEDKKDAQKIVIRIGVHIGDVLIMDTDVIGNGVNIASRIEPLAEPGGVCISADVYNLIKRSIDIKVVSLGKKELKNIKDAPEIYKILLQSIT